MRAMIFAAGRGERMRPLTDSTPKPLLKVRGKPLIAWHLERLAAAGIDEVVINIAYLATQFPAVLGDGTRFGLRIHYACEGETALETGGGMLNALPLLGTEPFIAVSGDVFADVDFARLPRAPRGTAHLLMVDNPAHHPEGDFSFDDNGTLQPRTSKAIALTWSGIGVFSPAFLSHWREDAASEPGASEDPPRFPLRPLLHAAIRRGEASGEHHCGFWSDVGTPERLREIDGAP